MLRFVIKSTGSPGRADYSQRHRTLRLWISNTVEDQPWQSDNTLDVDAFDFSTNMDSSFRVKIEGRLLDDDEEESDDSDDEDEEAEAGADSMDVDKKKKTRPPGRLYKFSHFFKSMTVDFDRNQRTKDGADQSVEWKKPSVAPNANGLPAAADFDQLEFKRSGDENCNIVINLVRDETPERFQLSPVLAAILDTNVGTREEVTMGIWSYIKAMGLADDDEKRTFELDERLRPVCWLLDFFQLSTLTLYSFSQVEKKVIGPNLVMPSYPIPQFYSQFVFITPSV